MNTELRKEAKNDFGKDFLKLMNNSVFQKTMENVRKHRDIKLITTEKRRLKLVSEPNHHTTKHFSENLIAIEMKRTKVKMNKPIYLGASILDISKTLMCKFWYDYHKPKYNDKLKLCFISLFSYAKLVLLLILKLKIFIKTLLMMLKDGLIHLIMIKMIKDHYQ